MQEASTNGQHKVGIHHDFVEDYTKTYDQADQEERYSRYAKTTQQFYNLVTDFYEIGWGQSFHFGVRRRGESMQESIKLHQTYLADRLGLRRGMHAVDMGCGVGGPMRGVARHSGARVTGINISAYQAAKVRKYNRAQGLDHLCDVIESDFLNIPVGPGHFDAGFAFEATCHAPNKPSVFGEAARVIKSGGYYAVYEWCITPKYDDKNPVHRRIRFGIEKGNALPSLATFDEVIQGMEVSGFQVVDALDRAHECDPELPWYSALDEVSVRNLPRTPAGRTITNAMTSLMEKVGVAPKGTHSVSDLLNDAADNLVGGGKLDIFTPMYFVLARKK